MRQETLAELIKEMQSRIDFYKGIQVSCHSCDHFFKGVCKKFNATPPTDFLDKGCAEWFWNDLPF